MKTGVRAQTRSGRQQGPPLLGLLLRVAGAGLLFATAGIHLDLYLTGYNNIATIGWLFLLQVIAALGLGLVVLVTRSRAAAAAGAGFALATLVGYLITVQWGLFGFREVRTTAGVVAGVIEVAAFAVLAVYAVSTPVDASDVPAPSGRLRGLGGPGWPGWADRYIPSVNLAQGGLAVAGVCVLALGLLGGALAGAGGGQSGQSTAGSALRTEQVGGVTVLANANGRTLYWFAPDTAGKSACYGSCAVYWPPLKGPVTAPAGVTGTLGTIRRTDGSTQETYNGHPLYTYVADSGPGQAQGNNLNMNGGLWHEVVVTG
ncbi:MAG TPA: hypothetical protein VGI66_16155 [Streptosporangiaceae bacterium]